MYEQPDGRGRGPLMVGLAVFFLAIIGSAVGLIAARTATPQASGQQAGPTPTVTTPDPGPTTPVPPTTTPPTTAPPQVCPAHMEELAKGELGLVLYARTAKSQIWICKNQDKLYYQGFRGGPGDDFTDTNSLFLADVEVFEDRGYLATNTTDGGTTTYLVTREMVTVTGTNTPTFEEKVVETQGSG